jgi:DNA-binding SARP family transcriptional activator
MPDDLEAVYQQVRSQLGNEEWPRLSAHEQTVAVYQEMRLRDAASIDSRNHPGGGLGGVISFGTTIRGVVRLRLTGQMEAWTVSGENVLPTGRKTRALFAAVAMAAPRPALRARLAELIWSRRPEEQARASLRQEIQLLLRALAPAKTEVLHVTRDHLSLAPGVTWVDVEEIMRASASKPAALSLLDGELLEDLEGIDPAFDMWLTTERERIRDRARGMAESLLREQTDATLVIPAAQRLLQIDRAHEEAWRALMRAHAEQGERGMAIQAYHRCRAVLADLLDAVPSAETQTLLNELRGPSSKRMPPRPPRLVADAEPVTLLESETETMPREMPPPREGVRVGVLPIRCVGLPDDIAYLGPSLANEITLALSRFRWMTVVSSNSTGSARDGEVVKQRDRWIDFMLDGAIQRSRNKLRITLRLLDLREDNQVVWARRFDRSSDDLLAVQEDVSAEVAAQIDPVMLLIEAKRGAARHAPTPSVYDLILLSVPLITRLERNGFMRAGAYLQQAIALDPEHAASHAWYAAWYALLISQNWASDVCHARRQAGFLAERATSLAPDSAGAFTMCGLVRAFINNRPSEAAALHEHALLLNPNLASAWALSAITQVFLGHLQEAERRYARYKALSPLDPYSFIFDGLFAVVHILKHDYPTAVTVGRAVTQLHPGYSAGYKPYLAALGHLGHVEEASVVLRRLMTIEPGLAVERCLRLIPLQRAVDRDHFAEGLRLAGVPLSCGLVPEWGDKNLH